MRDNGELFAGNIAAVNSGGALVQIGSLRGFIPFRDLDPERLKAVQDTDILIGQPIRARVMLAEQEGDAKYKLILSERKAIQLEAVAKFSVGDVVKGTVSRVEEWGAFLSVPGPNGSAAAKGLIHATEISWPPYPPVDSVLCTGQQVEVKVVGVNKARGRLSLSLKAMQQDPLKETIESLEWRETDAPLSESRAIIELLRSQEGVQNVKVGRQAEEQRVVSQDLEMYMTKAESEGMHTIIVRAGRSLQELYVQSSLSRDLMKRVLQRVLAALR